MPGAVPKYEWSQFVYQVIDQMYAMCNIGISFNLLTTYNTFETDSLFYLDPKNAFDYCCKKLSRFVTLDQGYPLYEWTISVFRKEYIVAKYPQPEFSRYL